MNMGIFNAVSADFRTLQSLTNETREEESIIANEDCLIRIPAVFLRCSCGVLFVSFNKSYLAMLVDSYNAGLTNV